MGTITRRTSTRRIRRARKAAEALLQDRLDNLIAVERRQRAETARIRDAAYAFVPADPERLREATERAAAVDPEALRRAHPNLYALWQTGALRPWRLTIAFNQAGAEGDWVDTACGAAIPELEQWEHGLLYPGWDQLARAAELTSTSLHDLLTAPEQLSPTSFSRCASGHLALELRSNFHPAIVRATTNTYPNRPTTEARLDASQTARIEIYTPFIDAIRNTSTDTAFAETSDREIADMIR